MVFDNIIRRIIVSVDKYRRYIVHSDLLGIILEVENTLEIIGSAVIFCILCSSVHLQSADFATERHKCENYGKNYHEAPRVDYQKHGRHADKWNNVAEIQANKGQKPLNVIAWRFDSQNETVIKFGIVIRFQIKRFSLFVKLFIQAEINLFFFDIPHKLTKKIHNSAA